MFEVDSRYQIGRRLGKGAFGVLAEGLDLVSNVPVAVKRVSYALEDAITSKAMLREIRMMRHFKHENILSLKDIMTPPMDSPWSDVYLVLDLMDTDLHYVLHSQQALSQQHVQWVIYQLCRGLKAIHSCNVLHRDLKPSNLLINRNVDLKIADFGLARGVDASRSPLRRSGKDAAESVCLVEDAAEQPPVAHTPLTEYVVTRWYRAPELLVQNREYDQGVDLWSVGCILAECLSRTVLLPGKDYLHQTKLIVEALGVPPPEVLARTVENVAAREYISAAGRTLSCRPPAERMPAESDPLALDLMTRLLAFDSKDRPSATEALDHSYFRPLKGLNDEPDAPPFDFDFEQEDVSGDELRLLIWEEMRRFHPEVAQVPPTGGESMPE